MAGVKIAHTSAFEVCEGGTCKDPGVSGDKKKVFCKQGDDCQKGGCYCQLFRRKPDAAKDDPWEVVALNSIDHEAKNEPTKWSYKCICVRPILEGSITKSGESFKVRYQICEEDNGLCSLERTDGVPDKLACTGDCANKKCKCTLFELWIESNPAAAKWHLAAAGGKKINLEPGYYYRCFCLKRGEAGDD